MIYNDKEAQIMIMTNRSKPISFSSMNRIGGVFGGNRINMTPTIRIRFKDRFTSEFSYNYIYIYNLLGHAKSFFRN